MCVVHQRLRTKDLGWGTSQATQFSSAHLYSQCPEHHSPSPSVWPCGLHLPCYLPSHVLAHAILYVFMSIKDQPAGWCSQRYLLKLPLLTAKAPASRATSLGLKKQMLSRLSLLGQACCSLNQLVHFQGLLILFKGSSRATCPGALPRPERQAQNAVPGDMVYTVMGLGICWVLPH